MLAEYISKNYRGKVVEIGIGRRLETAAELATKGFEVVAVDVINIIPDNFTFFRDDVTDPEISIYRGASLIYSIRPPPELFPYIVRLAESVKADCIIRPLGNEFPVGGKLVNYGRERFYIWRFRKI